MSRCGGSRLREPIFRSAVDFQCAADLVRRFGAHHARALGQFGHLLTGAGGVSTRRQHFDATLHLGERNGWWDSQLEGAIALLGGLPYATIYS